MSADAQRAEIPMTSPHSGCRSLEPRLQAAAATDRAFEGHALLYAGRREILDATAALWCCNAGHNRGRIVEAIQRQAGELDFSPTFHFGHPLVFQLASRIAALAPADLDHVFFNQLRLGGVRHRAEDRPRLSQRPRNGSRQRLIGRERHHASLRRHLGRGMSNNRKFFGSLLTGVDHLPATYNREHQASQGEPECGRHLADALEASSRCMTLRPSPR